MRRPRGFSARKSRGGAPEVFPKHIKNGKIYEATPLFFLKFSHGGAPEVFPKHIKNGKIYEAPSQVLIFNISFAKDSLYLH